jgi:hypothetical protein
VSACPDYRGFSTTGPGQSLQAGTQASDAWSMNSTGFDHLAAGLRVLIAALSVATALMGLRRKGG